MEDLLAGTRPVNNDQYAFICEYIREYDYQVKNCASKNMAIRFLLEFRDRRYTDFLSMFDVIKLAVEMNYRLYDNENIQKLNLRNQDRKLLTDVIDRSASLRIHQKESSQNLFRAFVYWEKADDMSDAEIVVSDQAVEVPEGVEVIRSHDTERMIALMNA